MSTEKLVYALRQVLRADQEEQELFQWAVASRKASEEFEGGH